MSSLKWRTLVVIIVWALAILWNLPNITKLPDNWPFSKKKLSYGLDIQGGIHLVMGVDVDGVIRESATRTATGLPAALKEDNLNIESASVVPEQLGQVRIKVAEGQDVKPITDWLEKHYQNVMQILSTDGKMITMAYYDNYLNDLRQRVVGQAIETIRNRIDEFGVAEPSITAEGSDRILVQLPGIADASRAKELINKTARLDFMLVDNTVNPQQVSGWVADAEKKGAYSLATLHYTQYVERINKDIKDKLPPNTMVLFSRNESAASLEAGKDAFLVRTDTGLGGNVLKDAYVGIDQYGKPEVHFSMEPESAKKFADLTTNNKGRMLAVVLDKVVKSAPVINGPIPNGEGVITLGSGRDRNKLMDEAKLISMSLRAGALPAALQQLEERSVGPTLGADSIHKGAKAAVIGSLLVLLFMLFYYKAFGAIADLAMLMNLLITFAVLTTLGATLSLPGVAGMALTVGMAVDANVIIFERIKEEMRKGIGMKSAIREGYDKAFSAIFDANVTTVASCLVLMYYGTGPVRGFAVTLTIGLAASMFTAVYFTRVVVEWLTTRAKLNLSI